MVAQYIRWDFIGLSTDTKPTSANEKVTNGSTYYESDTSKYYVYYEGTWYEKTSSGGGGTTYTAGEGIDIEGTEISVDTSTIQEKLTAGANISIDENNEISATDTTYSAFTGTDGTAAGTSGLVPAPATTDAGKFLKADGTWDTAGGSSVTVVQTAGNSQTDVMSQNAVTSMVFANPSSRTKVKIGANSYTGDYGNPIAIGNSANASGESAVSIGDNSEATNGGSVAIGGGSSSRGQNAVALGNGSGAYGGYSIVFPGGETNQQGVVQFALEWSTSAYNNTKYRLLKGLYDGQDLHDAATVAQGNTLSTSAPDSSTKGVLGQLWTDTTNMHTYQCTAISGSTYTWTQRW